KARISGSTANGSVGLFGSNFDFSWEVAATGHKREKAAADQSMATADAGSLRGIDLSRPSFIPLGRSQLLYKIYRLLCGNVAKFRICDFRCNYISSTLLGTIPASSKKLDSTFRLIAPSQCGHRSGHLYGHNVCRKPHTAMIYIVLS